MLHTEDWFNSFDLTKEKIEVLFLENGFKKEWEEILRLRKWRRYVPIQLILNGVLLRVKDHIDVNTLGYKEIKNLIKK